MYTEPNVNKGSCEKRPEMYLRLKRLQDVILSILALIVLLPVLLLIALIILIESPGKSPIFVQTRVGLKGKTFKLYKFRTMVPDAENHLDELLSQNEMNGPVFKIRNDPRITRVGRFLRKASLDELPQLWNVLRGDMSLVGPRPPLPREVARYNGHQRRRLAVKPGLTCYWQVTPGRNTLSFDQWMELDLRYIHEQSLRTDGKILLATVGAVLGMEGA